MLSKYKKYYIYSHNKTGSLAERKILETYSESLANQARKKGYVVHERVQGGKKRDRKFLRVDK